MRGEDVRAVPYGESNSGTSPRAWRVQTLCGHRMGAIRDISTHAEKTDMLKLSHHPSWEHLHVRGENHRSDGDTESSPGTSPHTRRKQPPKNGATHILGNISTYVEKTGERPTTILRSGTSPRMRRER